VEDEQHRGLEDHRPTGGGGPAAGLRPGPGDGEHERRDPEGRGEDDGHLAEGVQAAEVHQDEVDDVVPVGFRQRQRAEAGADPRGGAGAGGAQEHDGDEGTRGEGHEGAGRLGPRCRRHGETGRQQSQDEQEDDQREGLDEELGQREIGGTLDDEQQGDRVAHGAEDQHGRQAPRRHGQRDRCGHDDQAEPGLHRPVDTDRVDGAQPPRGQRARGQQDRRADDDAEVRRQGAALHPPGDGRRGGVHAVHRLLVAALRLPPRGAGAPEACLRPGHAGPGPGQGHPEQDRER